MKVAMLPRSNKEAATDLLGKRLIVEEKKEISSDEERVDFELYELSTNDDPDLLLAVDLFQMTSSSLSLSQHDRELTIIIDSRILVYRYLFPFFKHVSCYVTFGMLRIQDEVRVRLPMQMVEGKLHKWRKQY